MPPTSAEIEILSDAVLRGLLPIPRLPATVPTPLPERAAAAGARLNERLDVLNAAFAEVEGALNEYTLNTYAYVLLDHTTDDRGHEHTIDLAYARMPDGWRLVIEQGPDVQEGQERFPLHLASRATRRKAVKVLPALVARVVALVEQEAADLVAEIDETRAIATMLRGGAS